MLELSSLTGLSQGVILSTTLFNMAMSDLPPLVTAIPGLKHAIYADDITLWCYTGSPGTQQETL